MGRVDFLAAFVADTLRGLRSRPDAFHIARLRVVLLPITTIVTSKPASPRRLGYFVVPLDGFHVS